MEYLYLAAAAAGSFALGWNAARLSFGRPVRPPVSPEPVPAEGEDRFKGMSDKDVAAIFEDDFTKSVNDWGVRLVR